jgi:hypothetical protein
MREFGTYGEARMTAERAPPASSQDRRRGLLAARHEDRRVQPRPGQTLHEHRIPGARPPEHGLVGHVRPRQRVARACPGSWCCSPDPRGPACRQQRCGAAGFLPSSHQGVPFRGKRRPRSSISRKPEGHRTPGSEAVSSSTSSAPSTASASASPATPGDRDAHLRLRDGLPHADQRPGTDGSCRPRKSPATLDDVRGRRPAEVQLRRATASSPAAWSSAACASSSSTTPNWDHHGGNTENLSTKSSRSSAAMWTRPPPPSCSTSSSAASSKTPSWSGAGEFGRTPMGEMRETGAGGRDHHIDAFTMWMAGGGVKAGADPRGDRRLGLRGDRRQPGPRPRPARDDAAPTGLRPRES